MKRLIIAGAGAFGREVLDWAMGIPPAQRDWEFAGFLDLQPGVLKTSFGEFPVWQDSERHEFSEAERLICAIGPPRVRLRCCRSLKERGAVFSTLIHPTALVGSGCRIGEGCILCPFSQINNNVTLGNFVMLNCHASAGHDVVMGDGCALSGHAEVTGGVILGEGVFLGSHASVLPHVRVGDYATVGAGSVAIKNVKPGTTVFGVPAMPI